MGLVLAGQNLAHIAHVICVISSHCSAGVSYYAHVSLGHQDLDRSVDGHVRTYTETPQPPFHQGESAAKLTLGWVIDRRFFSGSLVGSSFTRL